MQKHEHLRFLIDRFDHYYDAVNNKGSFYIGLNTFILGGTCVGYISLNDMITIMWPILTLTSILLLFCFASIYFTISAIMPFLRESYHPRGNSSMLYFGGIANHALPHFQDRINRMTEADMIDDMTNQVHCLANGLKTKYTRLKYAGIFIVMQFSILLPLLLLIFKNIKK